LEKTAEHIKTFRPQLIIFMKDRQEEVNNLLFSMKLSGETGLTVCATVLLPDPSTQSSTLPRLSAIREAAKAVSTVVTAPTSGSASPPKSRIHFPSFGEYSKLIDANIENKTIVFEEEKIFTCTPFADNFREGVRLTVQLAGIGKLRPNIVFFVFPNSWQKKLNDASETSEQPQTSEQKPNFVEDFVDVIRDCFDYGLSVGLVKGIDDLVPDEKLTGNIDVYWLNEDGGLTALLPHLLRKSRQFKRTKLRFFTRANPRVTPKEGEISQELLRMHRLLKKFRIRFAEIKLIKGLEEPPSQQTIREYQDLNIGESPDQPRTRRYLRLSERITQESCLAQLVVISLPIPEQGLPAPVYMSWLHFMTKGVPRCVLVRGNNETVLTHLS